jgi:hypothetical protein
VQNLNEIQWNASEDEPVGDHNCLGLVALLVHEEQVGARGAAVRGSVVVGRRRS